ncbi:MAG: ROK family protein [Oscillospiraceae bacterium]|nr:ROK family protein [Oscillospiraceae bacterium]
MEKNLMQGNALTMKEVNRGLVQNALQSLKRATKKQLAQHTGLSVVTVNSVLKQLILQKEVFEEHTVPSAGGRPAQLYCYNPNNRYIAVLFGHMLNTYCTLELRVYNLFKECVFAASEETQEVHIESFVSMLDSAAERYTIAAIGFGLPGAEENGNIYLNDFQAIVGVEFLNYYHVKYQVPVVYENDLNAAVLGYYSTMAQPVSNVVGICFPATCPPGAGIVIDGKIYKGSHNFAGEVSNVPVGVDWNTLDYANLEAVQAAVAKLTAAVCSILAPQKIILYGTFFTPQVCMAVTTQCVQQLNHLFVPEIEFSRNFIRHFEIGIAKHTLEQMEPTLVLSR